MRVLMINSVCGIGSTGRMCTDLATELEKHGHQVKIAYGRGKVPEKFQKYSIKIGTDVDVAIHGVKARVCDASGFGSEHVTKKFIKWIISYDPDIIHLHNIHGYYINICTLFHYLKTQFNGRVIWTLHDCWAFTGHCVSCHMDQCDKWKMGCCNCDCTEEYPKSFIDRSGYNWKVKKSAFSDVPNLNIVTPSCWLAQKVRKSFLKRYNVQVINNGINTDVFKHTPSSIKQKYGIENKKVLLGVASVWTNQKGFSDFIELSKKISDEYCVVLIGVTDKQIKLLPSNVIGLTRTNNISELVEWYSAAEYFVNPTYEDNYPTVNLEAISCGTPVITYKTGGSPESANGYGIAVEKGVDNLIHAIYNPNFVKKESTDSVEYMINQYIKIYNC